MYSIDAVFSLRISAMYPAGAQRADQYLRARDSNSGKLLDLAGTLNAVIATLPGGDLNHEKAKKRAANILAGTQCGRLPCKNSHDLARLAVASEILWLAGKRQPVLRYVLGSVPINVLPIINRLSKSGHCSRQLSTILKQNFEDLGIMSMQGDADFGLLNRIWNM